MRARGALHRNRRDHARPHSTRQPLRRPPPPPGRYRILNHRRRTRPRPADARVGQNLRRPHRIKPGAPPRAREHNERSTPSMRYDFEVLITRAAKPPARFSTKASNQRVAINNALKGLQYHGELKPTE